MKVFFLLLCFVLGAYANRVKRVVGGEKAAIPQPLPNLQESSTSPTSPKTQQTQQTNVGIKSNSNEKPTTTSTPVKGSNKSGNSDEDPLKTNSIDTDSPDSVEIFEEDRSARIFGVREKEGYIAFKGIPYAEPPVGRNRFQRPIIAYMKGQIKATEYASPCVQVLANNSGTIGNEDCLYLNVYTPSVYCKNASGLPVLFWIHGGGFIRGSGNQYSVRELVKKNNVVVTINYRLGTLGFLGSTDKQMAGNAALFDIRAAFEWTRRYIVYFGGNPRRIFMAGQGTGASVAMLFAQSDFTAGYIQGVLAMSGTGISSNAVDYTPNNTSQFISQTTNCNGLQAVDTVKCLQNCDLNSILKVQQLLEGERIGNGGFVNGVSKLLTAGPIVEGKNDGRFLSYFLTNNPLDALKNKKMAKKIPLLTGTTKSETGKAVTGKFKNDVERRLKVPEFLEKVLPLSLVDNNIGLFSSASVNKLIKSLFSQDKYLSYITSSLTKGLNEFQKVIESTTDALFNLPAATTSTLWDGDSYFYSFQYQSDKTYGNFFLEGSTLQSPITPSTEKSPSHGDDLIYLFETQSLEGKPLPEATLKDQKDLKVKEIFTTIVSDFLKTGKPRLPNSKEEWRTFKEENSHAVITEKPKVEKRFRFCQIALWGGYVEKLKDPFCNLPGLQDVLKLLPEDVLKGGLLGSSLKSILPQNNLLMTNQMSQNGIGSLTDKLHTPKLNNPLLGAGSVGSMSSMQPNLLLNTNPSTMPTMKTPVGHLQVKLPGSLG